MACYRGPLENVDHQGNSFSYSPSWLLHYPNLDPTFSDFKYLSLIHLNGITGDMQRASVFEINLIIKLQTRSFHF